MKFPILFLLLYCVFLPSVIFAGNGNVTISGFVKDSVTKQSLISVTSRVLNSKIGTKTNQDGFFQIEISDSVLTSLSNKIILQFSSVAYSEKRIQIDVSNDKNGESSSNLKKILVFLSPVSVQTNEVFVSASQNLQSVQDIPITTAIIESSFIKDRSANSLERIMQYVSGVEVNSQNISVRGSSGFSFGIGSRVALLIDGFPILSGDNADIKFDALPFYNINRIEVIKGAGSALFGTSAVGGTINVITQKPEEEFSLKSRVFSGFYTRPSYPEWRFNDRLQLNSGIDVNISQKIENFAYVVSGAVFKQEGYRMFDNSQQFNLFSKFYYDINRNSSNNTNLDISLNFTKREADNWVYWKDIQNAFLPSSYPLSPELNSSNKFSTIISGKHFFDENNFMVIKTGVYHTFYTNNLPNDNIAKRESNANVINTEVQMNNKYSNEVFFTYGLNSTLNSVTSITYGDNSQHINSVFAQTELTYFSGLITTLGFRYDVEKTDKVVSNSVFSPKLGLNYKFNQDHSLRFSFGKGFRAASIAERFSTIAFNGVNVVPNLDLKAERSVTYEIGMIDKFDLGKVKLQLDYSVFQNDFSDFIDPVIRIESGNPVVQFQNITEAKITGLEINFKTLFFDIFGVENSITLMDPVDKSTNEALKYRSRFIWQNRIYFPVTQYLQLQAEYRYKSKMDRVDDLLGVVVKDYDKRVPTSVLDFRVIYNLENLFDEKLRIALNVNNVLNYYYVEMAGSLAPTRFVNLQLEYSY